MCYYSKQSALQTLPTNQESHQAQTQQQLRKTKAKTSSYLNCQ